MEWTEAAILHKRFPHEQFSRIMKLLEFGHYSILTVAKNLVWGAEKWEEWFGTRMGVGEITRENGHYILTVLNG